MSTDGGEVAHVTAVLDGGGLDPYIIIGQFTSFGDFLLVLMLSSSDDYSGGAGDTRVDGDDAHGQQGTGGFSVVFNVVNISSSELERG